MLPVNRKAVGVCAAVAIVAVAGRPEPAFTGLNNVTAVALSPQGAIYAATPAGIRHVLGPSVADLFVKTPARALAFDANGNLYAASGRAIVRIAPWGEVSAALTSCGGKPLTNPSSVAVDGESVYYVDAERVCRGEHVVQVRDAALVHWSTRHDALLVADSLGVIWRWKKSTPERLADTGAAVSAIAVSDTGDIYIARAGQPEIAVYSGAGGLMTNIRLSSPASALTFGGVDHDRLFAALPSENAIHRVPLTVRGERAPWEAAASFRIVEPFEGAILNRHDGREENGSLRVRVAGICAPGDRVSISGQPAKVTGTLFEATVSIRDRENRIVATNSRGEKATATVLWDRNSFPRYRMSVDDNIYWLKDIALHTPAYKSIFDNPYLAFWRDLHEKYGTRVHFNIYYETKDFNLTQMPDRYKDEWRRNADWIRLTLHARANDPDRPYLHTTAERIRRDYDIVNREIERFAGREVMSTATTVHWGESTLAGVRALREAGVRAMAGYFELRNDIPAVSYHVTTPQLRHLLARDYWKDTALDVLFTRHDMVINGVPLDQVVPRLEKLHSDPHQSELLELMIHEQHWYPGWRGYRADYREAVERAVAWAVKNGYKSVFLEEGFLGNTR